MRRQLVSSVLRHCQCSFSTRIFVQTSSINYSSHRFYRKGVNALSAVTAVHTSNSSQQNRVKNCNGEKQKLSLEIEDNDQLEIEEFFRDSTKAKR